MIFSDRKTISLIAILLALSLSINAQEISGRIISKKGGEAIPFANVLVQGTTVGVASNADGEFTITIPSNQKNGILSLSAVGFKPNTVDINTLNPLQFNIFTLQPQEYNIDEVDVEAESKVLYGAVKKCSKNIPKNYISTPFSCHFTYTNNGQIAEGTLTDNTGYIRSSFQESFKNINYQFNESEDKNIPYFSGKTNMEDLLSFDLVRITGNLIDEQNVYDYTLSLDHNNKNDQLWVIHFTLPEPQLYNTGDAHATRYEGELYIAKENFSILKTVVRGWSNKRSIHGKSIRVSPKSSAFLSELNYEVVSTYHHQNGQYRLDKVTMTEHFTDAKGKAQTVQSELKMGKILPEVKVLKHRDYFVKSL